MLVWTTVQQSLQITALVFLMMIAVDFLDVRSRGRIHRFMKGGLWRQYVTASFLGITPGCLGAFMNVTLYIHGFLTFGAIVAGMIATSGDEAFVMLTQFPVQALILFGILFVLALPLGWLSDRVANLLGIVACEGCHLHEVHPEESVRGHYFKEHIWKHIVRRHIWRVLIWTFLSLLTVQFGLQHWALDVFIREHLGIVLFLAVIAGIIPESGPHLVFVMLYADGLIPFSVLLASSISQDGHGMLPLLSYTIRDSLLIKAFNLAAALAIGGLAYLLGF